MQRRHQGFTLIELAIVLVIIGLLIGGLMGGRYMLKQSKLQTLVSDITKYSTAVTQFKAKYGALPGDLADATDYWNADPNGCPSNSIQTPRKETCNGDGPDAANEGIGAIGAYNLSLAASWSEPAEAWRAWQQLADAGMISGLYSGVAGSAGIYSAVPGVNSPASALDSGVYKLYSVGPKSGDSTYFDSTGTSVLLTFGKDNGNSVVSDPILTPRELAGIDSKIDDGTPSQGALRSFKSQSTDCGSTNYNAQKTVVACGYMLIIDNK